MRMIKDKKMNKDLIRKQETEECDKLVGFLFSTYQSMESIKKFS